VFVYGGTIRKRAQTTATLFPFFEAVAGHARGHRVRAAVNSWKRTAITGPRRIALDVYRQYDGFGHRGMGMSLPKVLRSTPSEPEAAMIARRAGAAVVNLIRRGITPRDILNREAAAKTRSRGHLRLWRLRTNAVAAPLAICLTANIKLKLD